MRLRLVVGLALASSALLAPAAAHAQDDDAPSVEKPPFAERTLLVLAFDGADRKLVAKVADAVKDELGLKVEVVKDRPEPTTDGARDERRAVLAPIAEQLGLDTSDRVTTDKLERQVRTGVKKIRDGKTRKQILDHLDAACRVQLSAGALIAQASELLKDRLADPAVLGLLAVTDEDIAHEASGEDYVFGWANVERRTGVVSSLRLADKNRDLHEKRAAMQALQTAGLAIGLGPCPTKTCARNPPLHTFDEHDMKDGKLCARCRARLAELAAD